MPAGDGDDAAVTTKTLKKKRGGHKAYATKVMNDAESLVMNY